MLVVEADVVVVIVVGDCVVVTGGCLVAVVGNDANRE